MKNVIFILLVFLNPVFAQDHQWTKSEIETYVSSIDNFKVENTLVKISYPNMSGCGGAVDGYFLDGQLVLIDSRYSAELGFTSKTYYLDQRNILKMNYREYSAEWGKYEENYPSETYEWDPTKMTYSDTLYSIFLTCPIEMEKMAKGEIINRVLEQGIIDRLTRCGAEMSQQLDEVVIAIDSLRFVTDMPYICHHSISGKSLHPLVPSVGCGDELYWNVVKLGNSGIEMLIDKMDDTTTTEAVVPNFGYNYTVADIAYTAIQEIIHNLPTFELLGVPFDLNGCGYCAYWQHLNKSVKNRKKFKKAVWDWYHDFKDQLTWVKSQAFETCDCSGPHPNGGHYELPKR
jgi:hypothetical protein